MDRRHFLGLSLGALAVKPALRSEALRGSSSAEEQALADLARTWNIPACSWYYRNSKGEETAVNGVVSAAEIRESVAVTPDTPFQVASMTKVVVGHLVLQLMDEGLWDLDKPMFQYLPNPRAEADSNYKNITARMLLQHRGGWVNWAKPSNSPEWSTSTLKTQFEPGTRFSYSGEGIYYLQKVAEKITGMSLETLADRRVFQPLGMARSAMNWRDWMEDVAPVGHDEKGKAYARSKFTKANGAYSMWSTAKDYGSFAQNVIFEGWGLKPETHELFLKSRLPIGNASKAEKFKHLSLGMSVFVMENEAGTTYYHSGTNRGYRSLFMANPDTQEILVALTNSANGRAWISKLAEQKMTSPQTLWLYR